MSGTIEAGDDIDDANLYELLQWEQVDGPAAAIANEYNDETLVYLPGDAPDGMELGFRLTATLGEVSSSGDVTVAILPATPTGVMDDAVDVLALGASVASRADNGGYWLGTATGTFARAADGAVAFSEELGSRITAIQPFYDGTVLIALPDLQTVSSFNPNNNLVTPFLTELTGGGALGLVSTIAVVENDAYFGTEGGMIVYYDGPDDAEPELTIALYELGATPTALTVGDAPVPPDVDEGEDGLVLYCGTADGNIVQIGLTAVELGEGPELGVPTPYLSIPGTGAVTGLAVDGFGNMWVAKAGTLYLVRRLYEEAPTIVRSIDAPAGLGGFAGLRTDDNDALTWIDPSTSRVASLRTYE